MMWRKAPTELVELFHETMGEYEEADKKKMFGYPCCFVNGNMFTGLHQENWVVRLSESDRQAIYEEFAVEAFEPMPGRKMREYVVLPKEVVSKEDLRRFWVEKSLTFAKSLPPK